MFSGCTRLMPVATAGARPWAASWASQLKYSYANTAHPTGATSTARPSTSSSTNVSATSLWMMPCVHPGQ